MTKPLVLAAALAFAPLAMAQTTGTQAEHDLSAKVLQLQQAGVDTLARRLVEQPAAQLLQRALQILPQRITADKREAVAKSMQDDARKYVAEAYPAVRQRAEALAPATAGKVLEDGLSADELKQVAAMLESPVWRKYQALAGDMEQALAKALVADVKPTLEPKVKALDQVLAGRLGILPPAAPASGASR
jgi:hypothetical protein